MTLEELRIRINDLNDRILELFLQRQELAGQVAQVKHASGSSVYDPARERQILSEVAEKAGEERLVDGRVVAFVRLGFQAEPLAELFELRCEVVPLPHLGIRKVGGLTELARLVL